MGPVRLSISFVALATLYSGLRLRPSIRGEGFANICGLLEPPAGTSAYEALVRPSVNQFTLGGSSFPRSVRRLCHCKLRVPELQLRSRPASLWLPH